MSQQSTLTRDIIEAFAHPKVRSFLINVLGQDLETFHVKKPKELAELTIHSLSKAKLNYQEVAKKLALEIYPNWQGQNVRNLYHEYNWRVERSGTADIVYPLLTGKSHIDIGGGPGTFALEILQRHPNQSVTIVDISDYRIHEAKENLNIKFQQLSPTASPTFHNQQFDTATMLYVLHHVEMDHTQFLKEWARCIRKKIILFEDVKINTSLGLLKGEYRSARKIEKIFFEFSDIEQQLFIVANDYICNHIASQALDMPIPGKYYEFRDLKKFLERVFPNSQVTAHYHGMYDTKCYPGPEAMFVVEF